MRSLRCLHAGLCALGLGLGSLFILSGCDSGTAVQNGATVQENKVDMQKGQQATADYYKSQKKGQ